MLVCAACARQSLDDFLEEGEGITRALVIELKQVRTRDDLLAHAAKLQQLFNALVDVIIRAQEFKDLHPNAQPSNTYVNEQIMGDQLRVELNRVLRMEGGREVIEKTQEEALNRLDTFEQSR